VAGAAAFLVYQALGQVDGVRSRRLAVVAVAAVAVHLQQCVLVARQRIALAERAAEQRLLPVRDFAVRGGRVDGPALAAVARRAAELFKRMLRERRGWMRAIRLLRFFETLERHRLVAGDAAVGARQLGHPDLLHTARQTGGLVLAKLAGHHLAELHLVVAPVVRAVAPHEQGRADHEDDADNRQHEAITEGER
jgi:hypothetical protein